MSMDLGWLTRLDRDRKGIWGVLSKLNSSRGAGCLLKLNSNRLVVVEIEIVKQNETYLFKMMAEGTTASQLDSCVDSIVCGLDDNISIRIIVHGFHFANVVEQCLIIKRARSIQESSQNFSFQFVFCGTWSFFSFKETYEREHGLTNSPAAELKNILYAPFLERNDVLGILKENGVITQFPTELDLIACDFLIEQTSGDELLISEAINHLRESSSRWPNNVESVLEQLVDSNVIVENIKSRVNFLNEECRKELRKLLISHRLIRPNDSISSELLWLSGLTRQHDIEGRKRLIEVSCPIVDTVLRNISHSVELGSFPRAKDLCLDSKVISMAAYVRVAEIENFLRCLIVSVWYQELGNEWVNNLNKTKTPALEREESEELIQLVLRCIREEFPELPKGESAGDKTPDKVGHQRNKRKHETILESAMNWQKRQNEHESVVLASNNLMHFLTTEALSLVIVSKDSGFVGDAKVFTKRDALMSLLDEYRSIRSAVAHNQPIMLATIAKLDSLLLKLASWVTIFIDSEASKEANAS